MISNDLQKIRKIYSEIHAVHRNSEFYIADFILLVREIHSQKEYELAIKAQRGYADSNYGETSISFSTHPFPGKLPALPLSLHCGNFLEESDEENVSTFLKQFTN